MNVIVVNNYDRMSEEVARIVRAQIVSRPTSVLGLATGSSPLGVYGLLAEYHRELDLDFQGVSTFNLDEYVGLAAQHPQSYSYYMHEHFFSKVNLNPLKTFVPNGAASDLAEECSGYEKKIREAGGIDLQILGIGANAHIGFNEPGAEFGSITRLVDLTPSTIEANSRFFESAEEVPTRAISMGIKSIMKARKIVLMANGGSKASAIYSALRGPVTADVPASVLQLHPDVTFVLDQAAAGRL